MKAFHGRLALALATGVASVGLFGAAALGAFGPEVSTTVGTAVAPATSAVFGEESPDRVKAILDSLVQKGVITQAQADAILAALKDATAKAKDAAGNRVKAAPVLRDFLATSATYLGITEKELRAKLPGTSLGAIANATANKNKAGLVAALSTEANADINKALANKRITEEQANKLRTELPANVTAFVDKTWPAKAATPVRAPNVKTYLGDLMQAARDYLGGVTLQEVTTAMRSGKSLGEIANEKGKTAEGLINALVLASNARIDQAVAEKKLTAEQAAALKIKASAEITSFVNRKHTVKTSTTNRTTAKP